MHFELFSILLLVRSTSMKRNIVKATGVGFVLALLTLCLTGTIYSQTSGHHISFTANQLYTFLSSGVPTKTATRTLVQRTDGSNAEHLSMSGEEFTTFFEAGNKRVISVDPKLQWASVRPAGQQETLRYLAVYPDCMSKYGGGVMNAVCTASTEKILGYDVIAVVRTPKSDASSEFRYWAAPALNYFPLREEKYRNGELLEKVESVSITLGDPDPKLFVVPDDYKIGTRAEYYLASRQATGLPPEQQMLDFYHSDAKAGAVSLTRPRLTAGIP
jgi:hypothetical protein